MSTHNSAGFYTAGTRKDFSCRNDFFIFWWELIVPLFRAGSKPPQDYCNSDISVCTSWQSVFVQNTGDREFLKALKIHGSRIQIYIPCVYTYAQLHAYTRWSTGLCIQTLCKPQPNCDVDLSILLKNCSINMSPGVKTQRPC